MIRDTRGIFISVNTEVLKELLVSGGEYNGIPSFYAYPPHSIKLNYNLKYFLTESEIKRSYDEITNFGYNIGNSLEYPLTAIGNITNVSIGPSIYIDGLELFETNISITVFPDYSLPEFLEEIIYENQIKIVGNYIDGSSYTDSYNNAGKLIKKTKTVKFSEVSDVEVLPKMNFGTFLATHNNDGFMLSAKPSNYRYIIVDKNYMELYVDLETTEVK